MTEESYDDSTFLSEAEFNDTATYVSPKFPVRDFPNLAWLKDKWFLSVSEIAYHIDHSNGNQTLYYSVRDAEEVTSLSVIKSGPDGVVNVYDAKTISEQFAASSMSSIQTISEVYASNKDYEERTLGYLERDHRVLDGYRNPFLNIYRDNSYNAGFCYYLESPDSSNSPISKISAVPSHKCVLIQVGEGSDVGTKALLICCAKKFYRNFFPLNLSSLQRCDNNHSSLAAVVSTADQKLPLPISIDRQKSQKRPTINRNTMQESDTSIGNKSYPMTDDQVFINKVGYSFEKKSDYYVVRPGFGARPILIIEGCMVSTLVARVQDITSLGEWFHLNNVNAHTLPSRVMAAETNLGTITSDDVFGTDGRKIMRGIFTAIPHDLNYTFNYTMFCTGDEQPIAFISFNANLRYVVMTMRPTLGEYERQMLLAFAIKMMYNTCRLHYERVPEFSCIEEVVRKTIRPKITKISQ